VSRPLVVVQLSDPHVGADWGPGGSVAKFAATVAAVGASDLTPDAVVISGDLADHGADDEYEQLREVVAPLDGPLYVLPGNHDDRAALRRHFDVPGSGVEPVQYAADLGRLGLITADTKRMGEDAGELDAERLAWLEAALADAPEVPTLLALHHPPLTTGIVPFDEVGLPPDDQRALAEVVGRHPQVRRIVAGHMHMTAGAALDGRTVFVAPSTYVQAELEFGAEEVRLSADPPAFAVHALVHGELVSYAQPVRS
jgi:3',5'-cyclic-AMP phosphodiesterase